MYLRAITLSMLLLACFATPSQAAVVSTTLGTFGPVGPVTSVDQTVVTPDATFRFIIDFSAGANTPVSRAGPGSVGVAEGASDQINGGQFLDLSLSVSVSNITGGKRNAYRLSFEDLRLSLAANTNDQGTISGLANSPGSFDWPPFTGNLSGTTFTGTGNPIFDIRGMNDSNTDFVKQLGVTNLRIASTNLNQGFVIDSIGVSVIATPEPSSFLFGLVIALMGLVHFGWRRFRQTTATGFIN